MADLIDGGVVNWVESIPIDSEENERLKRENDRLRIFVAKVAEVTDSIGREAAELLRALA